MLEVMQKTQTEMINKEVRVGAEKDQENGETRSQKMLKACQRQLRRQGNRIL